MRAHAVRAAVAQDSFKSRVGRSRRREREVSGDGRPQELVAQAREHRWMRRGKAVSARHGETEEGDLSREGRRRAAAMTGAA